MRPRESARVSTGIRGLDEVLNGGLPAHRVYLLEGDPGTGKTTVALQFLLDGVAHGERCLYVTLGETVQELTDVADSHGWSLDGLDLYELTPSEGLLHSEEQYTIFHPSEIELTDTIEGIIARVGDINPSRVVIDSLAEFRLLAREPVRYRRQILALKQFFVGRRATVLLIDDRPLERREQHVQSIAHGVIRLEQRIADYGEERRRLYISKMRGIRYKGGYHDVRIQTGGVEVFPRVIAAEHSSRSPLTPVSSGIAELDQLLGGGLNTGTCAVLLGPSGVGKTVLASQFANVVGTGGGRAALYLLDERLDTFLHRAAALRLGLPALIDSGVVTVHQLAPGQISPGEFAVRVRRQVEEEGLRLLVLDSLNGYLNAMQEEAAVLVQLHELLSYLNNRDVLTLITVAQHGMLGTGVTVPLDVSYLGDTLILLRYFESHGSVRKAISIVKKRTGDHEDTIREFEIASDRVRVGMPLTQFQGVLTGVPQFTGSRSQLLQEDDAAAS